MKRRTSRETALALIYAEQYQEDLPMADLYATTVRAQEWEDDSYVRTLFFGVCEKQEELDAKIAAHAEGWTPARMPKISLAIMRIAVYEMLYSEDVPFEAAIDEALELAKRYDHEKAPAFINGVLNAVATAAGLKNLPAEASEETAEEASAEVTAEQ